MEYMEIRCPFTVSYQSKQDGEHKHKVCGKICVKVSAGSAGEAYCTRCNKTFDFEVSAYNGMVVNRVVAKQKVE
jgi:hypothetical protein